MTNERRMQREDAEALLEHIREVVAGIDGPATLRLSDSDLIIDRGTEGGFSFSTPGEAAGAHLFVASPTAPKEYPAGLPFVPNESLTVMQPHPSMVALLWWAPRLPHRVIDLIHHQSAVTGWDLVENSANREMVVSQRTYVRYGSRREVMVAGRMVVMLQKDADAEG